MANTKKSHPNSSNSFSVNLTQVEIPKLKEVPSRKNYYMTNEADNFFDELIYYYEKGNVHSAFVDNLKDRIIGSGMEAPDVASQTIIDSFKLNDIFKLISYDYTLYGGYAVEIIWNVLHTKINRINYLDFSKIRCGFIDDDTDEIELYYYSPDWHAWKKDITVYQKFNPDENSDNRQIYYYKDIYPGKNIYPRPDYMPALKWVYTEVELNRYYANLVKNNFVPTTMLTVNSFFDEEKQMAFEKSLKQFTGGDAAGTIFVIYNEGGDETTKPEILKFNDNAEDTKYQWLSQQTIDQLIIGHRIPNPLLAGVRVPGSLGASTELQMAELQYNRQIVIPKRNNILSGLNYLSAWLPEYQYDVKNIDVYEVSDENV